MTIMIRQQRAFTLIEVLMVIAIIMILAAIALPNFLEAQTRAKTSRALADMRSMATAIEAYFGDYIAYPRGREVGTSVTANIAPVSRRMVPLTTPIAYITSIPPDVFPALSGANGNEPLAHLDSYDYFDAASDFDEDQWATDSTRGAVWRLASSGPDLWQSFGIIWDNLAQGDRQGVLYDPTNGTLSGGDIVRLGAPR